ncbi:unnamed protein product [Mytilus edulis]|uniref:Uncharacterized protein n=1 Tax=Mytilus edulis TaxID=6550 RepID=A0A8S3TF47_MYTED|nr:unnamed protein product [Mytilus edulis]
MQFKSYNFDKERFLRYIAEKPKGSHINWTQLARLFKVKINDKTPQNGGQILQAYAKYNKIDISSFAGHLNMYQKRVRRAKKIINMKTTKVTIPTPRPAKKLKEDIMEKIQSGNIYIGEEVAPKNITTTKIDSSGALVEVNQNVCGRKIPLAHIRQTALQDQIQLGILNYHSNQDYENLSDEDVQQRYTRIGENQPEIKEEAINKLKQLERTRHLKIWHDHSDILNHSYICFMVSWLYDPANFLTDEEYVQMYPNRKPINIQSI